MYNYFQNVRRISTHCRLRGPTFGRQLKRKQEKSRGRRNLWLQTLQSLFQQAIQSANSRKKPRKKWKSNTFQLQHLWKRFQKHEQHEKSQVLFLSKLFTSRFHEIRIPNSKFPFFLKKIKIKRFCPVFKSKETELIYVQMSQPTHRRYQRYCTC